MNYDQWQKVLLPEWKKVYLQELQQKKQNPMLPKIKPLRLTETSNDFGEVLQKLWREVWEREAEVRRVATEFQSLSPSDRLARCEQLRAKLGVDPRRLESLALEMKESICENFLTSTISWAMRKGWELFRWSFDSIDHFVCFLFAVLWVYVLGSAVAGLLVGEELYGLFVIVWVFVGGVVGAAIKSYGGDIHVVGDAV